jgi:transketolase
MTDRDLQLKSIQYRIRLLKYIKLAGAGHTGGSLSCVDILNVLYNRILNVSPETFADPQRDRYVQSKGHSVEALYITLADQGFFPERELERFYGYDSVYTGHPTRKVNGVEHNTGGLGHGLAFSVGLALAAKKDKAAYRVFTLVGDGELAEGSNWESLMAAAHYGLDNLCVIVDRNALQLTGKTEDMCGLEPLVQKLEAFGASVRSGDGHDVRALTELLKAVPFSPDKPSIVIAKTVKGKGVSFMENMAKWHHGVPNDQEYEQAQLDLQGRLKEVGS